MQSKEDFLSEEHIFIWLHIHTLYITYVFDYKKLNISYNSFDKIKMERIYIASGFIAVFTFAYTITSRRYKKMPKYVCIVEENGEFVNNSLIYPLSLHGSKNVMMKVVLGSTQEYVTISHTWKEHDNSHMVDIKPKPVNAKWTTLESPNGKMHAISSLLYDRLGRKTAIWIDSICINQDDNKEKSIEVAKMDKIYKNANATYVLFSNKKSAIAAGNLQNMLSIKDWSDDQKLEYLRQLSTMSEDRWFSRCWTLQEVLLSKNVFAFTDNKKFADLRAILEQGNKLSKTYIDDKMDHKEGITLVRNIEEKSALQLYSYNFAQKGSALYCLHLMRTRECEQLVDIIYSMKGLLFYGKDINVVYKDKQNSQYAMKHLVEIAVKNNDFSFLYFFSEYISYMPKLDEKLLSDVAHVVSFNPGTKGCLKKDNNLEVEGWLLGTVLKVFEKKWNEHENFFDQFEVIKKYFGVDKSTKLFEYSIGMRDGGYGIRGNKNANTTSFSHHDNLKPIERLHHKLHLVWNIIAQISINSGVNVGYTKDNCILCKQKVHTSYGEDLRKNHNNHEIIMKENTCFVQISGAPNVGDQIIDIGSRNWAGEPVFLVVRKKGNCYMRIGMVRAAVLISGGTIYDQKPCKFTFENTA